MLFCRFFILCALAVFFIIVSVLLIIIVLLQKGRGGGLSAAFGGAGGQSAFGSKTGDYFTWVTVVIVGVFLLLAMVLTMNYAPEEDVIIQEGLSAPPGSNTPTSPEGGNTIPENENTPDTSGTNTDNTDNTTDNSPTGNPDNN